jgi:hypothetical protein
MIFKAIAVTCLLTVSAGAAYGQASKMPSERGAPKAAPVGKTAPGAVKPGTLAAEPRTSGNALAKPPAPGKTPSEQGAPTSAAVDSHGSGTTPGAVKRGTSSGSGR